MSELLSSIPRVPRIVLPLAGTTQGRSSIINSDCTELASSSSADACVEGLFEEPFGDGVNHFLRGLLYSWSAPQHPVNDHGYEMVTPRY